MTTSEFEKEEEIAAALSEAVKAYAPPPGLRETIRERLFGKTPVLEFPANPSRVGDGSPEPRTASSAACPRERRTWRRAPYAVGLAMAASLLVVLAIWGTHKDLVSSIAFADVQEAVQHVETAIVALDCPRQPCRNCRSLYRSDCDVVRSEHPNGMVVLSDTKQGRMMVLNPKKKTARIGEGEHGRLTPIPIQDEFASPRQFLASLADIEQKAVAPLGEREFDGRKLVGFLLPPDNRSKYHNMQCRIWVDPKTRLPIRCEHLPEDPGDFADGFSRYALTFTFNRPLDASLFGFLPPEGYTVLHAEFSELLHDVFVEQLPLPPKDEKLAAPIVVPGAGIGPVRFGMNVEKVIEVLGPPDNASHFGKRSPEEQRQFEEIYQNASKEAEKKGLKGIWRARLMLDAMYDALVSRNLQRPKDGTQLNYGSRGFELKVLKEQGLVQIICYGEGWDASRPFTGKTSKGIGMGATAQEIEVRLWTTLLGEEREGWFLQVPIPENVFLPEGRPRFAACA